MKSCQKVYIGRSSTISDLQSLFSDEPCWKVTPSDLVFLWEECQRCFYLKVVDGIPRPSGGFPRIFQTIDAKMRECLVGERTENISPKILPGLIKFGERWVESKPITYPNHITSCYIRGKLDAIMSFDNGTFGIVDFKTSKPTKKHADTYFRQLNAYAYCVLNAAKGKLALHSVTQLGLLVYEPTSFANEASGTANLSGNLTWIDVPLNPDLFLGYLDNVLKVLENVAPPKASPKCAWCQYRDQSNETTKS